MAEEIKDLIAKIQQEGIQAAQEKSAQIVSEADRQAQEIINRAKKEAQSLIEKTNVQTKQLESSTLASLQQAGRDLLISLRKEINAMLGKLIKAQLGQVLTAQELAAIIQALIKNASFAADAKIIISLNAQDKQKLEQGFFKQLADQVKKQIVLNSSNAIEHGFVISFDSGKSIFDFSDQALMEYLTGSFRKELENILKP